MIFHILHLRKEYGIFYTLIDNIYDFDFQQDLSKNLILSYTW
jgi:hypothetical protein